MSRPIVASDRRFVSSRWFIGALTLAIASHGFTLQFWGTTIPWRSNGLGSLAGPRNLRAAESAATPPSSIRAPRGFRVQLVHSAKPEEGSWISMTFDDRGRLIVARDDVGLVRLTFPSSASAPKDVSSRASEPLDVRPLRIEPIETTLRHCRGVLFAHGALYVSATDSKGFYRLRDTDGDDRFDETKLLQEFDYRSRYGHGTNQITLGPDGMIYLVVGNDVSFPAGTDRDRSPYRNHAFDQLLPDPHDAGQDDRVGYIARTDPDGRRWEIIAGGFRNQVDAAFNADGELFTYDADMEWDVGLPWYRPTRVNHVVSGGEYGWRWGTGKWPTHFADSLPTTLDCGLGSPTGVAFGYSSRFPESYRSLFYMADWQNGRILMTEVTPSGASYQCRYESFIDGAPLNVCDLTFGPDGAMYFITGGRGSQTGLYRVDAPNPDDAPAPFAKLDSPAPADTDENTDDLAWQARATRRRLETFHTQSDPASIDEIWPHLASDDRWLRFAARVALERQEVAAWRDRALGERSPRASIAALLALARVGGAGVQRDLLEALDRLPLAGPDKSAGTTLDDEMLVELLRVYELSFLRQGRPGDETAHRIAARLDAIFPHPDGAVSRELARLLVYLGAPSVVDKSLALIESAPAEEEQIHYAHGLVRANAGWNIDARRRFANWLIGARSFGGGKLVKQTVANITADFRGSLNDGEQLALADELAKFDQPVADAVELVVRPFVRKWEVAEAADLHGEVAARERRSSYADARAAIAAANCLKCHRVGAEGANVGPDLTAVAKRLDSRALAESIVDPSKTIDPKYAVSSFVLDDGRVIIGRPLHVSAAKITIETDPLRETSVEVDRASIEEAIPGRSSPMPAGLVDSLTDDELAALLAYLHAGGDPRHAVFSEK